MGLSLRAPDRRATLADNLALQGEVSESLVAVQTVLAWRRVMHSNPQAWSNIVFLPSRYSKCRFASRVVRQCGRKVDFGVVICGDDRGEMAKTALPAGSYFSALPLLPACGNRLDPPCRAKLAILLAHFKPYQHMLEVVQRFASCVKRQTMEGDFA
jgi:hypothetical protein